MNIDNIFTEIEQNGMIIKDDCNYIIAKDENGLFIQKQNQKGKRYINIIELRNINNDNPINIECSSIYVPTEEFISPIVVVKSKIQIKESVHETPMYPEVMLIND